MGSGALEKIVDGGFRFLLICSAVYFGAKYSPYVLSAADKIKDRIIPHSYTQNVTQTSSLQNSREPPASLMSTNPRLYNAIMLARFVDRQNTDRRSADDPVYSPSLYNQSAQRYR